MDLRTITLKLHKPSSNKRKILDEAILNYNMALNFLLDKAEHDLDDILDYYKEKALKHNFKDEFNVMALSKWVGKKLGRELNKFHVQPFKDALKHNFATILANYLRIGINETCDLKAFGARKNDPLFFCRYDTKRSYSILYDSVKDRYFAKLYLMNNKNARTVAPRSDNGERLIYIHKGAGVLEKSKKRESFIIVPLAFGKYQELFLKQALINPKILRTARLLRQKDEYYLSISIDCAGAEKIKKTCNVESYIGVSRGLKSCLNYTVTDLNGDVVEVNKIDMQELHKIANEIVAKAAAYSSQVIVQAFKTKGDKLIWQGDDSGHQLPFGRHQYNKLVKLLDYKLDAVGLPKPIRVSSVGIFYTCTSCGYNSQSNRLTKDRFICTQCGETCTIDELGSLNLARKLINYAASKIKIQVSKKADGVLFENELFGINCFVSAYESQANQMETLKVEIADIISRVEDEIKGFQKVDRKKVSLMMKLKGSADFLDVIEFMQK